MGLGLEETVVLCMGLIEPRKAQTCLAQAFRHVWTVGPHVIVLTESPLALGRVGHRRVFIGRAGRDGYQHQCPSTPLQNPPNSAQGPAIMGDMFQDMAE